MTDYTIRNLKDVKDSAPEFGLSPQIEARFARGELETEQVGVSYQRIAAGERQPFAHKHANHEEIYVVLSGGGQVQLDGELVDVRPLDAIRVAAETARAFAAGPDGLAFLAIGPHGADEFETEPWTG
jgi:quercetin dioxygenase-like cupin family protein